MAQGFWRVLGSVEGLSVEAVAWAFSTDLDHASTKFVLVALANCAGVGMTAWPSVEYLCKATSLNRKTVIEGLRRLREMGLIERTGEMTGKAGQVPVYRIVCSTSPKNGTGTKSGTSPENGTGTENGTRPVPKTVPVPVPKTGHGKVIGKVIERKDDGAIAPPSPRGTRLPADWRPSDELLEWAAKARPDLDLADVFEQFRDYYLSAPGQKGVSLRWDLTFRNWVKKQWMRQSPAKSQPAKSFAWLTDDRATEAKGREVGLSPRPGESWDDFRRRIQVEEKRREVA